MGIDFSGSIPTADVSPAPDGQAIVEQMDAIDRFTRRRLNELLSSMVEAGGWQALVRQIDRLYGERTDQLRALADQVSGLPANAALRHTLEAYCLSRLMLALHDQLAGQSAIVTQVLDDWFQAHREISIAQFEAQLHLDCARILLLDLDYASPPPEVALEQLSLAGEHCSRAAAETCRAPRQGVASEIELRRRRIDAVHAPVM